MNFLSISRNCIFAAVVVFSNVGFAADTSELTCELRVPKKKTIVLEAEVRSGTVDSAAKELIIYREDIEGFDRVSVVQSQNLHSLLHVYIETSDVTKVFVNVPMVMHQAGEHSYGIMSFGSELHGSISLSCYK